MLYSEYADIKFLMRNFQYKRKVFKDLQFFQLVNIYVCVYVGIYTYVCVVYGICKYDLATGDNETAILNTNSRVT